MELLLLLLLPVLLLLPLLFLHFHSNSKPEESVLKAYPIIGHLPHFVKNRHRLLDWHTELLAATPTGSLHLRLLGDNRGVVTADPAILEHALKTNFERFPKGRRSISLLEDFLGGGIFNSDGHTWRAQRKTASFEFSTKSLRAFAAETVRKEVARRLSPLLRRAAARGDTLDLQDILERFAFDNICQVAFGEDPACLAEDSAGEEEFFSAFRDAAAISGDRFRYVVPQLWKLKKLLNVGSERRLKESISAVDGFAFRVIRARRKAMEEAELGREDLLSRFMAGEEGESSDEFLRDVVVSFMLAGRDTTSSALSWFFWLLSQRPDVEAKILDEIHSIREKKEEKEEGFGFEDLREMNYLHAAISEAMRLYPPVPFNISFCSSDNDLPDGTKLRVGEFLSYNAYAMGRMKAIWGEDCGEFRPERWLGGGGEFRPESPFRYPIFHAGPRSCLGKEVAYAQMKLVAASLMEEFRVEVVGGGAARPEMLLSLTLRMKGGLPVVFRERT